MNERFDQTWSYTMGDGLVMPVFPMLKSTNWQGKDTNCHQPLLKNPLLPPTVLVALTYLVPKSGLVMSPRLFVGDRRLEVLQTTEEQVRQVAMNNLARRRASWKLQPIPTQDGASIPSIVCQDDLLAAERIMDPMFLKQAHKRLGDVPRLAVGIPRRGVLMAIAGDRPNCLAPFQLIVQDIYLDSGDEAIAPNLFEVREGNLVGLLR